MHFGLVNETYFYVSNESQIKKMGETKPAVTAMWM